MKYCNPIQDISAYLCDVPSPWRDAFAEALSCALSLVQSANVNAIANPSCDGIKDCESITQFITTIEDNILTANFVNEKNITIIRTLDLTDVFNDALDGVDPKCLMSQEDWDALTYQERLSAIFDKVCCVHGNCAGTGTGCGCDDCEDDVECIGLEACPCVTYEVTGTAPYSFSYKDCDTKEIAQFDTAENNVIHICAIRGTVITPDGVFCNQIADECSDIPVTTTTTSSSTTTTTAAPTTTTTSTSTTSTTTLPTTTTTTSSTTTTTTAAPTTTTTTSTTTTSSSTTTTTTSADFWAYYLADEYFCADCVFQQSSLLVKLPATHVVQLGKYYMPFIFGGLLYQIISLTPQPSGLAVELTEGNWSTCGGACQ